MYMHMCNYTCMWGPEVKIFLHHSPSYLFFWDRVSLWTWSSAYWPAELQIIVFLLPYCWDSRHMLPVPAFYVGAGNPNSGSQDCTLRALSTSLPPEPLTTVLIRRQKHAWHKKPKCTWQGGWVRFEDATLLALKWIEWTGSWKDSSKNALPWKWIPPPRQPPELPEGTQPLKPPFQHSRPELP